MYIDIKKIGYYLYMKELEEIEEAKKNGSSAEEEPPKEEEE